MHYRLERVSGFIGRRDEFGGPTTSPPGAEPLRSPDVCRPRLGTCEPHPDAVVAAEFQPEELEQYRKELTGYCYRMLGSVFEADDAVQETMVRAWRAADRFEGRSSVRSWVYRIATNVSLDMLRSRGRRARPMDLGPSSTPEAFRGDMLPDHAWLEPPPRRGVATDNDPADVVESRESIRLAFVAALQHLPARQRAV